MVTGSSEGIGQEVARMLAQAGAEVVVMGSTQQRADESCTYIRHAISCKSCMKAC